MNLISNPSLRLRLSLVLLPLLLLVYTISARNPIHIARGAGSLLVAFQSDPLFNSTGMMPGDSVTRFFTVTNPVDGNTETISVYTENESSSPVSPALSDVMSIVISENGGGVLYGPVTLTQFYAETSVDLLDINAGQSKQFDLQVTFDPNAGNDYQLGQTQFDLVVRHGIEAPGACGQTEFDGKIFLGSPDNDHIEGTSGNDLLMGGEGNDHLDAKGGNDCVFGGPGNDKLETGSGNDYIEGGVGNDDIRPGTGQDVVFAGEGNDVIDDSSGSDQLHGEGGNDRIEAGEGNDLVTGGSGNDSLDGGSGNDDISGGPGMDTLHGGSGDDILVGDEDQDNANGQTGTDTCDTEVETNCEL